MTIAARRIELDAVLGDDPALKPRITEAMTRAYRKARLEAASETGLRRSELAESCPYTFKT